MLLLVNKIFVGTNPHFFKIKRWSLQSIGFVIGENTKIVFNSNHAKLIDLETEGIVNGNLDNRVAEGLITSETRDRLRE